jgi:diamine N-acetyltransferase
MNRLELYVPTIEELDYRQKIMSDPETMSYNKGYDLDFDGYHKDTGCIDFPESEWLDWYEYFVGCEPERFYAYIKRKEDGAFMGGSECP